MRSIVWICWKEFLKITGLAHLFVQKDRKKELVLLEEDLRVVENLERCTKPLAELHRLLGNRVSSRCSGELAFAFADLVDFLKEDETMTREEYFAFVRGALASTPDYIQLLAP